MSKLSTRNVSTNIPSARTTVKSAISTSSRPTMTTFSQGNNPEFIDYTVLDATRKEIINNERAAHRAWTVKFDPWLIEQYRQMYDNIAKVHGVSRPNCVISLKRSEWQQPANVCPPLHQRLTGQRRRRVLGAFPETENDKIGWRALPQQSLERFGRIKTATVNPLPNRYKLSNWPVESLY